MGMTRAPSASLGLWRGLFEHAPKAPHVVHFGIDGALAGLFDAVVAMTPAPGRRSAERVQRIRVQGNGPSSSAQRTAMASRARPPRIRERACRIAQRALCSG